jgi:hypothetical protein
MERDVALRIDGFLWAVRASLDSVAGYMKRNLSEAEYNKYIYLIGTSMAKTVQISNDLHRAFPDIVPEEFRGGSPPIDCLEPAGTRRGTGSGKTRKRPRGGT